MIIIVMLAMMIINIMRDQNLISILLLKQMKLIYNLPGSCIISKKNELEIVKLVPMGKTILRRVTFPLK